MCIKNSIVVCIICFLAICTLSCSLFTKTPAEEPIISDNTRGLSTYAINPSRRLVVVKPTPTREQEQNEYNGKIIRDVYFPKYICGEPPPDVSDNIASALSAALSAKGDVATKGSAEIAGNFAKNLNTTAVLLFKRSQGLQLYRDGMYNLCLAAMNGQIETKEQYNTAAKFLLTEAVKLIDKEIPLIQATVVEASAQNAASSATEAKKVAVDAEASAKNSKQSADAAEASAKKAAAAAEAKPKQ
jgi:hypothetical protein